MNYEETLTTLHFASRAIKITVHPHINEKIEMKKIKEKLNEFIRIKNLDSILHENHKLEKESNELKSNFNNFKNDLKKRNRRDYRSVSPTNREDEGYTRRKRSGGSHGYHTSNSLSKNRDVGNNVMVYKENSVQNQERENERERDNITIQEYSNITKKFHHIILHLQNELAKSTIQIHNLTEENKMLKEHLAKFQY